MTIITEKNSELATHEKESENVNHKHNSMLWMTCYNDTCQTHQSNKEDSEWYLKSLRQNLHTTEIKRHIDSSYSKSDSDKSYEVIEFSETE